MDFALSFMLATKPLAPASYASRLEVSRRGVGTAADLESYAKAVDGEGEDHDRERRGRRVQGVADALRHGA